MTETHRDPHRSGNDHKQRRRAGSAGQAARKAVTELAALTGHQPETAISIEPHEDGWLVGVEMVESHRIPDSADILAIYQVCLDPAGQLVSYRRTERYLRGQMHREGSA